MVVRYRFSEQSFKTYQAFWMMILGPPLREECHEVAEGVCLKKSIESTRWGERTRNRREFSSSRERSELSIMLFLDASYWSRKAETGLCQQTGSKSPPAEGSLASPDASPGIATWRSQPCV